LCCNLQQRHRTPLAGSLRWRIFCQLFKELIGIEFIQILCLARIGSGFYLLADEDKKKQRICRRPY
jgi:hypothetical protein